MKPSYPLQSGGQLVVKALEALGVTRLFSVPGESYLEVLDALYDSPIENTICRQEGGATMMAEAWGKATGQPGICFVTRGPGATNASAGIHVAQQDSTPMILFVGQINSANRHREGFQELDYRQVFGTMAKWVAEIDSAQRVNEMISRAWSVATSGRPGPVVLVLPEDTLSDQAALPAIAPNQTTSSQPCPKAMVDLLTKLDNAERPMIIVGGSNWDATARQQLADFARQFNLPVACAFRRQMLFNHEHSHYAGDVGLGINPKLATAIQTADVLLLLNTRFSEVPSQNFTLIDITEPQQTLIHVHSGVDELGKLYAADLAIHSSPKSLLQALSMATSKHAKQRQAHVEQCHQSYLDWSSLPQRDYPGRLNMAKVIASMQQQLPEDATITNGAGNYATWIHRFWRFRQFDSQLAPTSGSMGYGLPAAVAGKLAHPQRTVICMAGDGCYQMTMQELATAIQSKANIIIILVDNGIYGTIRMHQEKRFPSRISGTDMVNPDFAQLGKAYGINSARIETNAQFDQSLAAALKHNGCSLLHLILDAEVITPGQTISEIRNPQPKAW